MPKIREWLGVAVLLLSLASGRLLAAVPEENDIRDGVAGMPPGYHLRAEDTSPDKRFGVIHADASAVDPAKARNYLVALQPFRILSENKGLAFYAEGGSRAMAVEWAKDNAAVLVMVGGKWGTIGATLFELKNGEVTRRTDLLAAVTRGLGTKFPRKKVRPYNDLVPFVISDGDAWKFSDDGKQVKIEVGVDTAPNLAPGLAWRGTFKGSWSVSKARWLEQTATGKIHRNPE